MRVQQGFSVVSLLVVLLVLAAMVDVGYQVIPIYNVKGSVESLFDSIVKNKPNLTEKQLKVKIPELMEVQYIDPNSDVPEEFFDNLVVVSEGGKMDLSTFYHQEAWLLGMPKPFEDPYLAEDEMELSFWEKMQVKARLDFDFEIAAHTP
ncbi:MAG: hypothetical protein Q9M13_05830 [Mariprofundales bacterium]|nr:hypothetical protein [Mariprofundales bacterium]